MMSRPTCDEQTDVRATTLSAGVVTTPEAGSMVVAAYFYNSLPRAEKSWTLAPSLTLVVPSHVVIYIGINLESPSAEVSIDRPSLPRTCNVRAAKAAGAVQVHAGVHAAIVEACREHDLALVGDDCELTSTSGTARPSGQGDGSGPE
jgi:hypothetical protein